MKIRKIFLFAGCFASVFASLAIAAPQPFLPLQPAQLLALLPTAPPGWSMTSSTGANNISSGWVTSNADRSFKENPPPPGAPPKPPAIVDLDVTDTGYKSDFLPAFSPPKGVALPPNVTFLRIGNFPARMETRDDGSILLSLLAKNRFLIEIHATNMASADLQKYTAVLDFSKLLTAPDSGDKLLPYPAILSRVDELNPSGNRTYPYYWQAAQ